MVSLEYQPSKFMVVVLREYIIKIYSKNWKYEIGTHRKRKGMKIKIKLYLGTK